MLYLAQSSDAHIVPATRKLCQAQFSGVFRDLSSSHLDGGLLVLDPSLSPPMSAPGWCILSAFHAKTASGPQGGAYFGDGDGCTGVESRVVGATRSSPKDT